MGEKVRLLSAAEPGALLLAHPLCRGWATRAVVLLCANNLGSGAYGLVLNKALGMDLALLRELLRMRTQLEAARKFQGPLHQAPGGDKWSIVFVHDGNRDRRDTTSGPVVR